jgi:hypothetical protein
VLPVLLWGPSSASAQEPIADAEMVIRFGEEVEPVSEFFNPQPSGAVRIFKDDDESRLAWGVPVAGEFRLTFHAPFPSDIDPEGRRVELTFGDVFSLGRLGFSTGVIQGGEGEISAADLYVAVQLIRPAVPEPVIVTLPLSIDHFREQVTPEDLWATAGQVNFPQAFPTIDIVADGVPYKLKLIGFGSIGPGGTITTVSHINTEAVAVGSADLLASLELACDELELPVPVKEKIEGIPRCDADDVFGISPYWGSFKGRRGVLAFDSRDTLELECNGAFQLFLTRAGSSERRMVGVCPFGNGCNKPAFFHSGDSNKNEKPDCLAGTIWISRDYGYNDDPNPWTDEDEPFFSPPLDWAVSVYERKPNKLSRVLWRYDYAVFPPVEDESCKGSPKAEGDGYDDGDRVIEDPPLGEETDAFFNEVLARLAQLPYDGPMLEDTSKQCDFNGDQLCDAADEQNFEAILGNCWSDAGYHPQADVDGSGCVDAEDRFYMFEADRDADGSPDSADNCVPLANALQEDGDGDRIGDVCDECPFYAEGDRADADGDGRGDECECGDQNGDGHNTVSDLIAINTAIFNPSLATALCDGNNDGRCDVNDLIAANVEIFSPGSTSTCARQPVPGP